MNQNNNVNTNKVWLYDINANDYIGLPNLPTKIRRTSVSLRNGYLYVFGGKNPGNDQKYVYRLPTQTLDKWERLDDLKSAVYDVSIIPYN